MNTPCYRQWRSKGGEKRKEEEFNNYPRLNGSASGFCFFLWSNYHRDLQDLMYYIGYER